MFLLVERVVSHARTMAPLLGNRFRRACSSRLRGESAGGRCWRARVSPSAGVEFWKSSQCRLSSRLDERINLVPVLESLSANLIPSARRHSTLKLWQQQVAPAPRALF